MKWKVAKNLGFEEGGKAMGNFSEKEQNPPPSCSNPPPSSGEVAAADQIELGEDSSEHRANQKVQANGGFNSEMDDEVVLVQPVVGWCSSGAVVKREKNREADQTRRFGTMTAASSFVKSVVSAANSSVCLVVLLLFLVGSFVFASGCFSYDNNAGKNPPPGEVSAATIALPPPVFAGIVGVTLVLGGLLALDRHLNIKDKVPPTKEKKKKKKKTKQIEIKSEEDDRGAPSCGGKGQLEDDRDSGWKK